MCLFKKKKENKMEQRLGIQAPWTTFYNKVLCMFDGDAEISVSAFDYDEKTFSIITTNHDKYMALKQYMKQDVEFGNISISVDIVYNGQENLGGNSVASAFGKLFKGNPHVEKVKTVYGPVGPSIFVIFKKEVIQFYNDDISDIYGNWNGLMEDIAREIFDHTGISFCTGLVAAN